MFCSIFRFMISHTVDGNSRLSRTTEKHIRHCASCREFYQTCLSLGEGLTHEAAISNDEVSERLSARVLTAIHHQRPKTHKVRMRLLPMVAAACLALIFLTGVLFLTVWRDDKGTSQPGQVEPVAALRALVGEDFVAGLPGLIEEPLASEINNIADDTESALRFLVACVSVDITNTETNQRIE